LAVAGALEQRQQVGDDAAALALDVAELGVRAGGC
jgi:hypothetical protein